MKENVDKGRKKLKYAKEETERKGNGRMRRVGDENGTEIEGS